MGFIELNEAARRLTGPGPVTQKLVPICAEQNGMLGAIQPTLWRTVKLLLLPFVFTFSASACATGELVAPGDDQVLVGMTVSQAINRARIKPNTATLYTEPIGVPRGVGGSDERGHKVYLFFKRGGRSLDLRTDGAAERYAQETVVGVARVVGREESCVGEVVWHFCPKRAP